MTHYSINPFTNQAIKIGILGGGQLGKMYAEAALPWNWKIFILDKDKSFPAAQACHTFVEGDFTKYDDVINFGRQVDTITIEIEGVNVEALEQLELEGKPVFPSSKALKIIRDKGLQKQFYEENKLPTSIFTTWENAKEIKEAIDKRRLPYPFVQKARTGGYDGRGVAVIKNESDLIQLLDTPSIIEPLVDIDQEISVIVVRNKNGEVKSFPTVSMAFHPTANLVEYLVCPSGIGSALEMEAIQVAQSVIEQMDIYGLLAVEMFLTKQGEILINEVAPRPHNSGHQTIESCSISQFQMGLLAACNLRLPDVQINAASVMVNILGAEDHTGIAKYEGVMQALELDNVHIHLYGKEITKPFRKMGHVTITDKNIEIAILKAKKVKELIRVIT